MHLLSTLLAIGQRHKQTKIEGEYPDTLIHNYR